MKSFFAILSIIILFGGCSEKSAFSKFNMSKKQELSANSLQNSKIMSGESVEGIVSVIYLNEVYPEKFADNDYFFVTGVDRLVR